MLRPLERTFHQRAGHTDGGLDALAGAGVEFLPVSRDELRLVVEQIALARPAIHEELNNALRFRRVMWKRRGKSVALHQRTERDTTKTGAQRAEKIATGESRGVHGQSR